MGAILLVAGALRLWGLRQNGYGNLYYAAGVRSMLVSWRNFFFAAYDPTGFVALDKPPVAFWVQAASAKLLGFSGLSVLLPQALAGIAAVALLYHLVRRVFGPGAGLLAALTLALTPLSVAVDRVNNTDSLLALTLVVAAWPMLRAAETGRLPLLLLSMALVGVAFNVKMLAAYVVVPAFVLVYLVTAPLAWRARLLHLVAAVVVLVVASLSWALVVDLTPPNSRPYVGDSQKNSALELIVGYNGIARLVTGTRWSVGVAGPARPVPPAGAGPGFFPPLGRRFGGGPPGPLRFASRGLAGQITWFVPLAVVGGLAAVLRTPRRCPVDPGHQALLLWGVWVLSGAIVFSFAQGMFHPFYVVTMAPPLAGLVGAGVAALWADHRGGGWRAALLPAAFLLTAAWEGYILGEYPDWRRLQLPWLVGGSLLAVGALFASRLARLDGNGARLWGRGALAVGLIALFISPTVWALTPLSNRGMGGVPAAGPDLFTRRQWRRGGASGGGEVDRLVGFLQAQRRGERFLLATATAMQASPIIIQTGEAVMAIGGWGGSDPILTVDQFTRLVVEGQVRYVLLPELDGGPWRGGRLTGSRNAELIRWVREHGKPVDPALWRSTAVPADGREEPAAPGGAAPGGARFAGSPTGGRRTGGPGRAAQLFDCRPEPAG